MTTLMTTLLILAGLTIAALLAICAAMRSSQISADERRRQFHEAFIDDDPR
jgi:hypothetical protein